MGKTSKVERSDTKSPSTRLLDLLAGWSDFVSSDEENGVQDNGVSAEAIGELYQLAGSQSMAWDELSRADEDAAVSQFVTERVMPLMLRGNRLAQSRIQASGGLPGAGPDTSPTPAAEAEGLAAGRRG